MTIAGTTQQYRERKENTVAAMREGRRNQGMGLEGVLALHTAAMEAVPHSVPMSSRAWAPYMMGKARRARGAKAGARGLGGVPLLARFLEVNSVVVKTRRESSRERTTEVAAAAA